MGLGDCDRGLGVRCHRGALPRTRGAATSTCRGNCCEHPISAELFTQYKKSEPCDWGIARLWRSTCFLHVTGSEGGARSRSVSGMYHTVRERAGRDDFCQARRG